MNIKLLKYFLDLSKGFRPDLRSGNVYCVPRIVALVSASAHAITSVLTRSMPLFTPAHVSFKKLRLIIILISTGEELSQPTKHANKLILLIF